MPSQGALNVLYSRLPRLGDIRTTETLGWRPSIDAFLSPEELATKSRDFPAFKALRDSPLGRRNVRWARAVLIVRLDGQWLPFDRTRHANLLPAATTRAA
jgi:hypothetical protein